MPTDPMDLYKRASAWTAERIAGAAAHLDDPTPNDGWDVRTLLNHMLETQRYFGAVALGEDATPPSPTPPALLSDDPVADLQQARDQIVRGFGQPGVIEKTGPLVGIAFADHLLHGWDLAQATGQDPTMPEGLAEAAYETIHGRFTDEQRKGVFKPEIEVGPDASAQDRLLAYTGRRPA
jgi:uncharacterized protein (TIGR03086 family)